MTDQNDNTTNTPEAEARAEQRDTDASALGSLPATVTAFIDAVLDAVGAYEKSDGTEPRPVFGGIKGEQVLAVYQTYRAMTAEINARRPAEGLCCVVTQETLMGMAVEHQSEAAMRAIHLLEKAPAYYVSLHELLALHALMSANRGAHDGPRGGEQVMSYSARGHMGPPPEPPPVPEVPQVPPLAASVSPQPMHPVAMAAATGAPRPISAQPRPVVPPIQPSTRPARFQSVAPVPRVVASEGFVDVGASGLGGMSDDDVIAAVTAGEALDPSLLEPPQMIDPSFSDPLAGSSGNQPQSPGQLPVRHPLIGQQMDPRTGAPTGGGNAGPTPQDLLRMRRKMEGGG